MNQPNLGQRLAASQVPSARSAAMTKLGTPSLGMRLRSPLIASASPLAGYLHGLRAVEDAGAAAVVLPSLFEEEARDDVPADDLLPDLQSRQHWSIGWIGTATTR